MKYLNLGELETVCFVGLRYLVNHKTYESKQNHFVLVYRGHKESDKNE